MFCNKCGKELIEDSMFCNYCGNRIRLIDPGNRVNEENNTDGPKNDERNSENTGSVVGGLFVLGMILLMLSLFALYAVPQDARYGTFNLGIDWIGFNERWGAFFYMFDITVIIVSFILIVIGLKKKN